MSTSHEASPHPSFLALDRFSLGTASSQVGEHVASCDECQQYLQALAQLPAAAAWPAIQAGIAEQRRRTHRRWVAAASGLAAAAGLAFALTRLGPAPSGEQNGPVYVGAKGFASVWIYIKRGNATQLWDGKQPVFAGDRLRIKLDPAGFRQVAVYSVKDPEAPELLYRGSVVPGQSSTLPDAWEVDGEAGAERLVVVLSSEPVKPAWNRWLKGEAEVGISVLSFVLPKSSSVPPDTSAGGP
jgi:hypothetical protein